jgi:leucyl/phenylalanyl-tRNA---protein transferase
MLTAKDLLYGYYNGIFPMADADGSIYWYSPEPRAIIPIDSYKPAKSLRTILHSNKFAIKINENFREVMQNCAKPRYAGDETWINGEIIDAYCELHELGYALSLEAHYEGKLVGGLYGVTLGKAFFGESMFYTMPNASKVAFHYLMELLQQYNYTLLDTQFMNDNVKRYGAIEISKNKYIRMLKAAIVNVDIFEGDTFNNKT